MGVKGPCSLLIVSKWLALMGLYNYYCSSSSSNKGTGVGALPVDFYNQDDLVNENGFELIGRNGKRDPWPGICTENLNNDNSSDFRWYRYHNESHKCWHIDERGPCGKLMLFYPIGNTEYGDCDCNFYYRCARPLLYWPPAGRCYYTNHRGPCQEEEWLVLNSDLNPSCETNPCKNKEREDPSTYDRYWFSYKDSCWQTLSQGYCSNSSEVLYPKWDDFRPTCSVGRECSRRGSRRGNPTQCIPGQKRDMGGHCRSLIRINNWPAVSGIHYINS